MALLIKVAPPALALACWIAAFLLFPPNKQRRWPVLLFPMAALMISSILAFSGAKVALDLVRFGDVDPTQAASILGDVLLQESMALLWSAAAFLGTCIIEALRVAEPGLGNRGWSIGLGVVMLAGVVGLTLPFDNLQYAWMQPAYLLAAIGPLILALSRPDPNPERRAQRMVTLGAGGVMGAIANYLAISRLNEGLGYQALASNPELTELPDLVGWGLDSGFAVCAIAGACALLALIPARVGKAPEAFATSLLIALGVSTAALIFNVPTHFAKDRVRAYSRPGQFVVLESRLDSLPTVSAPGDPGLGSSAVLMLEAGRWFDSRTGVPVEMPLKDAQRYTDNLGRLVLALRPEAPAQELLATPFGVDKLAVVVGGLQQAPHDALTHTVYGVVPLERASGGQPVQVTTLLKELLVQCPNGCIVSAP
ncbi:MAG: hypothetical protein ACI9VR_001208 [Cognaticolwellia sp.]|jgi:hypothetical protein